MNAQPVNINKIAWRGVVSVDHYFQDAADCGQRLRFGPGNRGRGADPNGMACRRKGASFRAMKADDPYLSELAEINRSPYRAIFRATESANNIVEFSVQTSMVHG